MNRQQTIPHFSQTLLDWYHHHGRKTLPWKQSASPSSPYLRDPYMIWVSEIMLQQTQVTTVIPYFERFMQRFATISALAEAPLDEVLHHWSGLGYYARARNLHRAAQEMTTQYQGQFPNSFDQVVALPGIGRSTAGAILAQAMGQRHAILDGNVKRLLTRLHAIEGWPGNREVENRLWQLADGYTPQEQVDDYTQAIMDLGATLCRRGSPDCQQCPFQRHCQACQQGRQRDFPSPKPRKTLPEREVAMLIIQHRDGILLEQRPPSGLWGGLWGLPECPVQTNPERFCRDSLGIEVEVRNHGEPLRHSFSHFHLNITPILCGYKGDLGRIMDQTPRVWYNTRQPTELGLAAPVTKLLAQYTHR